MTSLHVHWLVVALAVLGVRWECGAGRVPKVYNALITSGQNLAPSKSFPVYQPFYQETYGFPFPATYYFSDDSSVYKSYFAQSPQLGAGQENGGAAPSSPALSSPTPALAARREDAPPPPSPPQPSDKPQEEAPTSQKENLPPQPPPPPVTQSPIPLNEFGLPPAIVPLNAGHPDRRPFAYDPFADFSPYYPQLDYPDPYSFRSYPLLPPIYRFGGELPRQGGIFQPQSQSQPQPQPQPQQQPQPTAVASAPPPPPPGPSSQTPPPVAPADLSLNNYSGKDPSIPDVPPPPLPSAGFNDAASKVKNE